MNKCLIKTKTKKEDIMKEKKRKSLYRGVSRNGNKWQTIISFNKKIEYLGVYPTEEIAARVYDIFSIKNRGIKAKTNFEYDIHQIQKITESNIDFKLENLDNILSNSASQ